MLSLLTFPAATDTIAQASSYANPWLTEFWPLVYIAVGIFFVGLIIPWLYHILSNAVYFLFHRNDWDMGSFHDVQYDSTHAPTPLTSSGHWKRGSHKWTWVD